MNLIDNLSNEELIRIQEFEFLIKAYKIYLEIAKKLKENNGYITQNDFLKICYILEKMPTQNTEFNFRYKHKFLLSTNTRMVDGKKIKIYHIDYLRLKKSFKRHFLRIFRKMYKKEFSRGKEKNIEKQNEKN